MRLYHFSEEPDISVFEPRIMEMRPDIPPLVHAIDEWHSAMYLLPRNCPRACFWPGGDTTDADRERWFGAVTARIVIAIESRWLPVVRETRLYRYELPAEGFTVNDATAGHYVNARAVVPLRVDDVGDLLAALVAADVELRLTPRLDALWARVIASTMEYSGTRLRNAKGFPLPASG